MARKAGSRPRQYTIEECRKIFLDHLMAIAMDCATTESKDGPKTVLDRINLAIFSVLVAIDGELITLPSFELLPMPHKDDKDYNRKNGANWWPKGIDLSDGELHSRWAKMTPRSSGGREQDTPKVKVAGSSPAGVTNATLRAVDKNLFEARRYLEMAMRDVEEMCR